MLTLTEVHQIALVLYYIATAGWLFGLGCIAFLAIREDIRNYRFKVAVRDILERTNMEDSDDRGNK